MARCSHKDDYDPVEIPSGVSAGRLRALAGQYLENIEMMLKMASDNTTKSEPKSGRAGF